MPRGRTGSGGVGSGRVGSGRVGPGRVGSGRVGSGRVGSGRIRRFLKLAGRDGLPWLDLTREKPCFFLPPGGLELLKRGFSKKENGVHL